MTTTKRNLSNREAQTAIHAQEEFSNATGSLRGVAGTPVLHRAHWLNDESVTQFIADVPFIVYTVHSYDTPIYWVLRSGTKVRVSQKFSPTTSKHMGLTPLASTVDTTA